MSLKNYKAGLSLALLFHVIAIFALTKLHWSEISPNTSKVGWKESHVIQSYLYESKKHEPYKMEKGSNAQKI